MGGDVFAQNRTADSMRAARQRVIDSTRTSQQAILEAARVSRKRASDSLNLVRKHKTDSLAALKKYKESRKYKDSVASARSQKLDSMKAVRTAFFDSLKTERERISDSILVQRKQRNDSVRALQKIRADSLAVISKYRNSKRYKDSVAFTRQQKLDSARDARLAINQALAAERKNSFDSAAAVRKEYNDSVKVVRKHYTDSIGVVRKARTDSLAKIKENSERLRKSREKSKQEKMQLALELKIKKKHEAWNNEKMLKKKWSAPRKALQNTFTRYNYYFNADRKMDEALENMQRMKKDDYDSLIALFPFDPDRDSAALAPDMDSIIQKASLGIQIHDPRTKWADDLYLLLGQAYYYKGNYRDAANSFRYIISLNQQKKLKEQKEAAAKKKPVDKDASILQSENSGALDFLKHKTANNEAVLWLARTYTESHKENDAESILELIESDKNLGDELKGRLALEKAYLNLGRKDYSTAAGQLVMVADDHALPEWVRIRAAYLGGQLSYRQGDYAAAAERFQKVADLQPDIEMDFYARKNLAYSLMEQGGSQERAMSSLRRMLNDGKYASYYEQIYYVLGRLASNSGQPDQSITYLKKSIESPKSTKKQKAASFAGLGNVYYSQGKYQLAKNAYDSAAFLSRSAPGDSLVALAVRRSKVLDHIVDPSTVISRQDSLLALAALSDKEQRAVVRRYIKNLEDRISDSTSAAENGDKGQKEAPEPGGDGNWYFSNPVLMQQGNNDFKRKWGSRPEVDNWRRLSGISMANAGPKGKTAETDEPEISGEDGLPTEASLLAAIPNTPEQKSAARQKIQKAYIDLANAYIKELEDYKRGTDALDTLGSRFAHHDHEAEAIYLRYLVALKENKLDQATVFSETLKRDYGETSWAKLVAPSDDLKEADIAPNGVSAGEYYDATYELLMQRQYGSVLPRTREGQRLYRDTVFRKRMRIMEAIALAGSGVYEQADSLMTDFISRNAKDSLRIWAEAVLNFIKHSKAASTDSSAAAQGVPAAKLSSALDSVAAIAPPPLKYSYDPKDEHYFVFTFSKMESKAMGVKAALSDFNTFNYSAQHLHSDLKMLQQTQGIIVVRAFGSAAHARIYMNSIRSNNLILKEYKPEEYQMFLISANNYKKLQADRDMAPYLKFYKDNYK